MKITYIQNGLDGIFNSIKDFPLQEHLLESLGALFVVNSQGRTRRHVGMVGV